MRMCTGPRLQLRKRSEERISIFTQTPHNVRIIHLFHLSLFSFSLKLKISLTFKFRALYSPTFLLISLPGRFRDAVAKFHQVDAECVVGGSGSDDILEIIIRVTAPKKILICTPTFGMYSFLGKMQVKCDIHFQLIFKV